MEKIIHAVFNTQEDAYQAQQKLNQLDANGDISLAETYIISKDEKGNASVKDGQDNTIDYTTGGALAGGLLGLLSAGPLGFLFGSGIGALAGSTGDFVKGDHTVSYLDETKKNLPNGKTVIIAHLYEDWEVPVDTSLKPFAAEITRIDFDEQVDKSIQKDLDEIDQEIDKSEKSLDSAADNVKSGINDDIAALKEKRKALAAKVNEKAAYQKQHYQSWIDKQKAKLDEWKSEIKEKREDAKKEKLEKEIARHEEKLAELKSKL